MLMSLLAASLNPMAAAPLIPDVTADAFELPADDHVSTGEAGVPVSLWNLGKSYGGKRVLNGVGLKIEPGEFIAVIGRSGCGKSTLMRLLAGLEKPDGGEIWFGDDRLDGLNPLARTMFQEARLLPWRRVVDNVAVGLSGRPGNRRAAAERALQEVGLSGRERDWPSVLSGGQRQRVALARALVSRPRVLILDEPLGALDALTRISMQHLIERVWLNQGFTAVMVTHDVSEAVALADRILLIEDGTIALDLPVTLDRPRVRGSAAFAELEGLILNRLFKDHELDGSGI
ncbi:sulfonate transport system ATP-binding protein [Azospirillum fermentarium]|uniref:ATP-binding cassette domain-containing protein n=1 Tax=Azospirillum fermentarium TaxID=1233114 RepID=UPI002225FEB6|nr:ATP-binding cassette domain-containing protein [Azospirillum fermentarium]MCW2248237.1 sulfonate transport system ATP-binding protein [Azospirillum fermentarium]